MTQLRSYDSGANVLYAAIWRPVQGSTRWVRSSTPVELAALQSVMEAEGYTLYQLARDRLEPLRVRVA